MKINACASPREDFSELNAFCNKYIILICVFKGIINLTIASSLSLPAETPRPIPCPAELWNDWGEAWAGEPGWIEGSGYHKSCIRRAHSTWGCEIRQKQYLLKYQFQSKTPDYCKFSPTSSIKQAPADQGTRLGSLFLRKIVRVPVSALSLQDSAGDCSVGLINQASRQSRTATQIETAQLPQPL